MPPSFGNAVVAANQQSICNLSNRDFVTPRTEWATFLHQWMSPSFGNAVVVANQQSICNLPNRDFVTPRTEWAIKYIVLQNEKPKWEVKWKTSTPGLIQITTTSGSSKKAPSNTFSALL